MVDAELVEKKLAFIETCVDDIRRLANLELIESDIREERFVSHTLQLAIQAALDVASHLVSDMRLCEPETNRELFSLLHEGLGIPDVLVDTLARMAGFRNILVHGYQALDRQILRHVAEHNLDDLNSFVNAVRTRLQA
jgi:uncharacterized protein YutE (UPF0331/DUF86 family)